MSQQEELRVVLDVDGVTRLDVTSTADLRVVNQVNKILALAAQSTNPQVKNNIRFTFLSGSHSSDVQIPNSPNGLDKSWRTPNLPLAKVFDRCFPKSAFDNGKISIYGQLGCDAATYASHEIENETSPVALVGNVVLGFDDDVRIKLLDIVIRSYGEFLRDTENLSQEEFAEFETILNDAVSKTLVTKECKIPIDHTPDCFETVASFIREKSKDQMFRLILHKGNAELGGCPLRNPVNLRIDTLRVLDIIKDRLIKSDDERLSKLVDRVSGGVAHYGGGNEFCWLVVTRSTKGLACIDLLKREYGLDVENPHATTGDEDKRMMKKPVIITVGDSHVDFSMHELTADKKILSGSAFHVGPPSTHAKMLKANPEKYSHACFVPLDDCGYALQTLSSLPIEVQEKMGHYHGKEDTQSLTTGTLEVLIRLEELLKLQVTECEKSPSQKFSFVELAQDVYNSFQNQK